MPLPQALIDKNNTSCYDQNMNKLSQQMIQYSECVGKQLLTHKQSLVTAESCTGGGIAHAITTVAGSSQWFERGYITYSNAAKNQLLDVSHSLLEKHGAVSAACAKAMAQGALQHSLADIALSVTGIAGPSGGDDDKPVGTIYFGCAGTNFATYSQQQKFNGDRESIRNQSIIFALQMLLKQLQQH